LGVFIIHTLFKNFYQRFPFLEIEQTITYFSLYGGIEEQIDLNLFEDVDLSVEINCVQQFSKTESLINPSYLLDPPYRDILTAIARGDGRLSNIYRRAKIGESAGREIIDDLVELDILRLESSRQAPLRTHPKHLLKKNLRGYRIEPKVRFVKPFYRFWFGFVSPYREALLAGESLLFTQNFEQHKERAYSLVFEQLSIPLLAQYFQYKDLIISQGGFWDHHSEFDVLSITRNRKIILGECKYTSRKVTKKELTKLKDKASHSGIKVDTYALFSKSGFSKELLDIDAKSALLFEIKDFNTLLD